MTQYARERDAAIHIALKAGTILERLYGNLSGELEMKGRRDWCTKADKESDALVQEELRFRFPDDDIVSEESDPLDRGAVRKWVIDPLDGTWAFTRGFPLEVPSVSIALTVEGRPVVGVVYAPLPEKSFELYWAVEGEGAFLHDKKIVVNPSDDLGTATVVHDIGKKDRWRIGSVVTKLLQNDGVMACPSFGGAASSYARVASGVLHGSATIGLDPWDNAAGAVLLREAGAKVTDFDGREWRLGGETLLAANPRMHQKLLGLLNA